ncbi:MAG TPA: hypothetical protein VKS79_12205 [Gemmataceae bacterium]|nr:hypothetical protein [Gemmataceae bacterium]
MVGGKASGKPDSATTWNSDLEEKQVTVLGTNGGADGYFVVKNVKSKSVLPGTVGVFEPLNIDWYWYKMDDGATKKQAAGNTSSPVYISYRRPTPGPGEKALLALSLSAIDYGCRLAAGSNNPGKILQGIWDRFSKDSKGPANAERVVFNGGFINTIGGDLSYYKSWLFPNLGGGYHGLLQSLDGQCGDWARFLAVCIAYQGLSGEFRMRVRVIVPKLSGANAEGVPGNAMIFKNWGPDKENVYYDFIGPPMPPPVPNAPQQVLNVLPPTMATGAPVGLPQFEYKFENPSPYKLKADGPKAQNNPFPPTIVPNHVIVWLDKPPDGFKDQKIFDPSFGKTYQGVTAAVALSAFQNQALSALYSVKVINNMTGQRSMAIKPVAQYKSYDLLKFLDQ